MFGSAADARQVLGAYLEGARLDWAVAGLIPTLFLEPDDGRPAQVGGTRFGGVPDLQPGTAWPRPPAPADAEAIASRGSDEAAEHMRRHFVFALPYAFMAQVDLAEAAACGPAAAVLPAEGRLLFFYDLIVGCYETGTRPCRVVWDPAPRDTLTPAAMPPELAAAAEEYREEMRAIRAQYNLDVTAIDREGTDYGTPCRPLRLSAELALPHEMADEGQAFWEEHGDALPCPGEDKLWERSKLLGCPDPVQGDPRWDAVVASDYGVQHLSSDDCKERRAEIARRAQDWVLLLQIDLADWMAADMTEGCVFFLIRREDLARRRFEGVVTVYQQT